MLTRFRWSASERARPSSSRPFVTLQLPIYDERTVAARLIRAAAAIDYPRDRFEIQVLDDSNDETCAIVDREARAQRDLGVDVHVLRRGDRTGFKAGALEFGLARAKGELICIFDADFTPSPSFLADLVGVFDDPKVGMVQARWGHENRAASRLTRAQSTLLDGHFVIEHKVRHDAGLFFNFNGTAGIWRKRAIEDAGGWQHDTLTEDLDLSYRAQLRGWKFVYAPNVVAPAEVPPDIAAFKSQQHRWAKGSVQVARKLGRTIVVSREPKRVKLEALAHLTGNVGHPLVLALAVLLPATIGARRGLATSTQVALFVVSTFSVFWFYETGQRAIGRRVHQRAIDVLTAVALGIGMSLSQTRAVFEGLFGRTGEFVRTAKRGDPSAAPAYRSNLRGVPGVELLFAAWFAWGVVRALETGSFATIPFLLLFLGGFAWVGSLSLAHWARSSRA